MEALLSENLDPDAPEPDTGAGQLTARVATIIRFIQTSRAALEENYNAPSFMQTIPPVQRDGGLP